MRRDLNKLLTERPRVRHNEGYHQVRRVHRNRIDDDEYGGRESMRLRPNLVGDRKRPRETLTPLFRWLNSCVGKNWNTCYSELCENYDVRSPANKVIFDHLWDRVEKHAFIDGDAVMVVDNFSRFRRHHSFPKDIIPIQQMGWKDFYICPKDGTLKKIHHGLGHKARRAKQAAEQTEKQRATFRKLNDQEVLRLIDGVWYHFDLLPIPSARVVYVKPPLRDVFYVSYRSIMWHDDTLGGTPRSWDELSECQRERVGTLTVIGETAKDEFTGQMVFCDQHGVIRGVSHQNTITRNGDGACLYHANRRTASKKQLKLAGIKA